jgi:hypothetical protein
MDGCTGKKREGSLGPCYLGAALVGQRGPVEVRHLVVMAIPVIVAIMGHLELVT